jgi:hypothetical protein
MVVVVGAVVVVVGAVVGTLVVVVGAVVGHPPPILGWDAGAGVVPAVQPSVGRTVWQSGAESSAEVSRADTISGLLMREEV